MSKCLEEHNEAKAWSIGGKANFDKEEYSSRVVHSENGQLKKHWPTLFSYKTFKPHLGDCMLD